MIIGILWFLVFALVLLLVVLAIEWVAGMFEVPANILKVFRAIVALIFLIYLVAFLLGNVELPHFPWRP